MPRHGDNYWLEQIATGVGNGSIEGTAMQASAVAIGNGTSIDTSGMETLLLSVSGITTATIIVEGEAPSGTWSTILVKSTTTSVISSEITANGNYVSSVAGYLSVRARISSYTSGTIVISGTVTAAGNHADVQSVGMRERLDAVNDAITTYPLGHSSTYISTATTTVVKTGAGVLQGVIVGETAAGAITIYDNTAASGTILAVLKASIAEGAYMFNIAYSTGLTVVTAGASKVTVAWR